jgi:tetratricopeptide (TPR) repeat protein
MAAELELKIEPSAEPGVYAVTVVRSPAGEATGSLRFDVAGLLARRAELQSTVLASTVTARRALSVVERPVREVGEALFRALFNGPVYGRYTASAAAAAQQEEPLRVVLRLRAPELAALPWEALFDPEAGSYLCHTEPLMRYVEVAAPAAPLRVTAPLRILGLVAGPQGLPALDVGDEQRRLEAALTDPIARRQVELVWATGGTWGDLQDALLAGPWHVVHFIGHGGYDDQQQEGVLALVDQRGGAELVTADRFTRLLHTARPTPRLVLLNSCSSGEAGAEDLFSSTGAALVRSGVSAAVAMQFAVSDAGAIAFARGFYAAMASNRSVGEAVRIGRIAIDGTGPHTLEWITPVLYLRGADTTLFTVRQSAAAGAPAEPTAHESPEQAAQEAALHGLYVQARAELRLRHYDTAATLFDSLLASDPSYRDATQQREIARRMLRLAHTYQRARAAEDAGDWDTAIREYSVVVNADPHYQDADLRLRHCRTRQEIAVLQTELRVHADSGNWRAVIDVSDELARLDPTGADPDGIASRARAQLQQGKWVIPLPIGLGAAVLALLGLGALGIYVVADRDGTGPTPSSTAAPTTTSAPPVTASTRLPALVGDKKLSRPERLLHERIPAFFASEGTCSRMTAGDDPRDIRPEEAMANLQCSYSGGTTVVYSLFQSDDVMGTFFDDRLASRRLGRGQGRFGPVPDWQLDHCDDPDRGTGRVYGKRNTERPVDPVRAEIGWIRDGYAMYAYAFRPSNDFAGLFAWWREVYGPIDAHRC